MNTSSNHDVNDALAKVPEVTLAFWAVKILATTLGETGGDAVSMSMNLGYLAATGIFATLFLVFVAAQIRAKQYHPALYWATIIASTTVGETAADTFNFNLGIGLTHPSLLVAALFAIALAAVFGVW